MTERGQAPSGGSRRSAAGPLAAVLAVVLMPAPIFAQALDGDRLADPPRPPAPIDTPIMPSTLPAALAPPDSSPRMPSSTSLAPPAVPAPAPPPASSGPLIPAGQSLLTVVARFGPNQPINGGLHWRVYSDKPDHTGVFRLLKDERGASPTFMLPAGDYVVAVTFGLASASRRVQLGNEPIRQVFELAAGGARFEGRVGDSKIPPGQISFDVFRGSQFEPGDNKRPIAQDVATGDLVLLPEGVYYVVSNYGDSNAVVRSDIRVQSGKLTDVTINHRAAVITLKLVSAPGGEALANTAWSVLTPGGDVIKESTGAFPRVVLEEGEYVAIARNDGKVYNQSFKVEPGFDREIEVPAR